MKWKFSFFSLRPISIGIGIIFVFFFTSFIWGQNPITGTVTDIDGNVYRTVKIGNQWWMAENLKVTHYSNGETIPHVTENSQWKILTSGAYCNYNNDNNSATTYGHLYNWYVVNDSRNIAPTGWRVPTDEDWKALETYLGMNQSEVDNDGWRGTNEGGKLKETGTLHWFSPNLGATNESGFSALPGGFRNDDSSFKNMGINAVFWSSTEVSSSSAWYRNLNNDYSEVLRRYDKKILGFSVRCIKDEGSETPDTYFQDSFEYNDSVTNHGWTFTPFGDDASVYTTTTKAHSGNRSLFMDSSDDDEQHIKHTFESPMTNVTVDVFMYDDLSQSTGFNIFAITDGTLGASIGFRSPISSTHYSTETGTSTSWQVSSVQRAEGWRKLSFEVTPTGLNYFIDGTLVRTSSHITEIKEIYLMCGNHGYGPAIGTVFFDDINVTSIKELTPIIFIPGIMGSPLYDSDNNSLEKNEFIWINGLKVFLDPLDSFLNVLRLHDDGESPFKQNYNIKVAPLANDASSPIDIQLKQLPLSTYQGFVEGLVTDKGYKLDNLDNNTLEGENLFIFTYDWRKSSSSNAQKLNNFINNVLEQTDANKVVIIAHSIGGLVAKKCISTQGFDKTLVDKIIFIGTPHLGAPKALYFLLTGNQLTDFRIRDDQDLDKFKQLLLNPHKLNEISRNMPSIYELLPGESYHDISLGSGITEGINLYKSILWREDYTFADYEEMLNHLRTKKSRFGIAFNSGLVSNSDSFRGTIDDIIFGDIKTFNIIGYETRTLGLVFYLWGTPKHWTNLSGDGTVPIRSAEIIGQSKRMADYTYYISGVEHGDLPSNNKVLDIIQGLLQDPPLTNFPEYTKQPDTYAADDHFIALVGSPVELHAYDLNGRHTGPTTDSTWVEDIPGSDYIPGDLSDPTSEKSISLRKGEEYKLIIRSQDKYGSFNLQIGDIQDGNLANVVNYDEIIIEPNTVAICSLLTISDASALHIDLDGNGENDTTITTTVITEIKNEIERIKPDSYLLSQNYPNPFNPETKIHFNIPKQTNVRIDILNILGQRIKTLIDEQKQAGSYSVIWDGRNQDGHLAPSGIYIYRIRADNFEKSKKLLLLR